MVHYEEKGVFPMTVIFTENAPAAISPCSLGMIAGL